MNITYVRRFAAECPVDGSQDIYDLTVESDETIPVEDILTAIKHATYKPRFQEEITHALASRLGASVQTVGVHSGVLTTVVCGATNSQEQP